LSAKARNEIEIRTINIPCPSLSLRIAEFDEPRSSENLVVLEQGYLFKSSAISANYSMAASKSAVISSVNVLTHFVRVN